MLDIRILVPHIDRSRTDIRVTHHDLEIPEVHIPLHPERGEPVSAGMRRDAFLDPELGASGAEGLLNRTPVHALRIRGRIEADKQRLRTGILPSEDPFPDLDPAGKQAIRLLVPIHFPLVIFALEGFRDGLSLV